jgi:hypothetical protein
MADYPAGTQWPTTDGFMSYENDPSQIDWSRPGPIDTEKLYGVDPSFYPEDVRQQIYARNTGSAYSPSGGGDGGGGGGGEGVQGVLDALLAGNQYERDFEREKWEAQRDLALKNYQLAQNADQRQAALLDLQKAQYQLSVLQLQTHKDQFAQSQYSDLAKTLLGTATSLTGPRDYAKFMQYTSGGRSLLDQLYGATARPKFSAPTQNLEPMTLQGLMGQLGLADQGTPGQPSAQPQAPASPVPLPHQINPSVWDGLGSTGQQIILGLAEKQGWDANEFLSQLSAARPTGTASAMTSYSYANQ